MLTIYNRKKEKVGQLGVEGFDVTKTRRLNSDYQLTFMIPMNSVNYVLLEHEGLIECEDQKYVIKDIKRDRKGLGRNALITCKHIMTRLMDIKVPYESAVDESFGADISSLTNIITAATGGVFTFQIMNIFPPKDVYKWGSSNCLKALQDLVNLYDVEFVPDNYNIKLYSKISIDNGMQYRFKKNIVENSYVTNTSALCTRITGLAKDSLTIINLPSSHLTADELSRLNAISGAIVGGLIKVPYLTSQYAAAWSTPDNTYFDSEFEATDIDASDEAGKVLLLEEIRKKLMASEIPDIQISINAADLWKIDSGEIRPQLGETVYLIDPDMEIDNIQARVVEMTEYPFAPDKHTQVTLANYLLKDFNSIISDLNASKDVLAGLMTNGNLNSSRFEAFARQALIDINNSKSEVIFDPRGIVLQSKSNTLHQVVESAEGIYITTDGGQTADAAITAQGIAAEVIVGILGDFAQVRTDNLIAGNALITSALIQNIKANQIDVTGGRIIASQIDATNLNVAAANVTGKLIASQIDATSLHVNSANIDGTIIADVVKSNWVYTGNLNASQITAGLISAQNISTVGLAAEKIYQAGTPNNYAVMGGSFGDMILYYDNGEYFRIGFDFQNANFRYKGSERMRFGDSGTTYGFGPWDLNGASVTGLSTSAITGLDTTLASLRADVDNLKNKAFILSYRSGGNIVFNSVNVAGVDSIADAS